MTAVNISGRVRDFYEGGGAYQDWDQGKGPESRDYDAGEWELFEKVDAAPRRYAKGGWWVRVDLSPEAIEAARYWAENLYAASGDNAADGDQDARSDMRAAARLLARLPTKEER